MRVTVPVSVMARVAIAAVRPAMVRVVGLALAAPVAMIAVALVAPAKVVVTVVIAAPIAGKMSPHPFGQLSPSLFFPTMRSLNYSAVR